MNSVILLYTLLTSFSFMLMLSIHLFLSTSKRHLFKFFSFRNFAIFAYIFPLILIIMGIFLILAFETNWSLKHTFESLTGEYLQVKIFLKLTCFFNNCFPLQLLDILK